MISEVINTLNEREKQALSNAIGAIYFNDSSDYLTALWDVVDALIGHKIDIDTVEPKLIYRVLNPED